MSNKVTFKKLTPIEHVLLKSGMYVGAKDPETKNMWIYENNQIQQKIITYIPALYKIFDEAIVNTYDQSIEDTTLDTIKVDIDGEKNEISVYNNGRGIPVEIHKEEKIYIPELIFSTLLTSSHYNENIRVTGGTYGLGIKLTAIFSKYFKVEIGDPKNKKKFTQVYENNLSIKNKPKIENYNKSSGYVKILFKPDLQFFKLNELEEDTISLFKRRTYDISALTKQNVSVYFNNEKINIKNFNQYVLLFKFDFDKNINKQEIFNLNCDDTMSNNRWKIIVSPSNGEFNQISFVNSIYTSNGGKHVDYILSKIIAGIKNKIQKKFKFYNVKDSFIKNQINLFLSSVIENPEFNSQTKEELITSCDKFGSSCVISDNYINKLYNLINYEEKINREIESSEKKDLEKISIKKKSGIKAINKLHDATYAGTNKSYLCTLILTEGDSAKTMAISGISGIKEKKAIDYYGIFPLKGKLLNVREATHKQLIHNEEFKNIIMIMGLEMGKHYDKNNVSNLRYGSILLFFDADVDGSHIKGLFINMINHYWPSLLKIDGYINIFITPMIKTIKGNEKISFYTMGDFEKWKKKTDTDKWKIKYYKGLGTSTTIEAQEYFMNLEKNTLHLNWRSMEDDIAIDLAFAKDKADDRKKWLKEYNRESTLDYSKKNVLYHDFINKELIHFSNYDNIRSIPNIMDGLKPSQRKILYSSFKKNLNTEIKVAQFVGYISEHTSYHHGENSLAKTIIGMAQNFIGSNNINLLEPVGQFGTRLMGGKDASSPRYIFTQLEKITRYIFHKDDDDLLKYLNDDGYQIEPEYYVPIIPMILVNGTEGIGTGYSTFIPKFNPLEIIDNLINKLNGKKIKKMMPWYYGFTGNIVKEKESESYFTKGIYKIEKNHLIISELPISVWTENFKESLDDLIVNNIIVNYKNNSTESIVNFDIKLKEIEINIQKDENGIDAIEKKFSLANKINMSNMYLYDEMGIIRKYSSVYDMLDKFYDVRLTYYDKRKELLLLKLSKELNILKSKIKFIDMAIDNKKFKLFNIPKNDLIEILRKNKLYLVENEQPYDYLIRMPFYSFSKEKIDEINKELIEKELLYNKIKNKNIKNMWMDDLVTLREQICKYRPFCE